MARKHTSDLVSSHSYEIRISALRQKSPCVTQASFTCLAILRDSRHCCPLLKSLVKLILMLRKLRQEDHSMSHTAKSLKEKKS